MLTEQAIEEELSYAYLHAVASRARIVVERPRRDTGMDAQISVGGGLLTPKSQTLSPAIEVQLKACCTVQATKGATFPYDLKIKNYNDLRAPSTIPRILVLLVLPGDKTRWLTHTRKSLIARDCAYWANLRGAPASPNQATTRIQILKRNVVTPDALHKLLCRVSESGQV